MPAKAGIQSKELGPRFRRDERNTFWPPLRDKRSRMSEDIRAGEIAVTLPETFDAGVYFIGRIRTPWKSRADCPRNARGSDAVCTIELEERYAAALECVATCTHLIVLYFMHEAR